MDWIRWVTIHPALVHFAIGVVPIVLLAYALAPRRAGEPWTFVGDVALWACALAALVSALFGVVAFVSLDWPGGLGAWRWAHLLLGAAATVFAIGFALARWRARRQRATYRTAGAALVLVALVGATGWLGGEVLVFRGGAAVEAAGLGALAPPMPLGLTGTPHDVHAAMHRIRAHWAALVTDVARMTVERPRPERFESAAWHARELGYLGHWLSEAHEPPADATHPEHGLAKMGAEMEEVANRAGAGARAHDLPAVSAALGELTTHCVHCHGELRWHEPAAAAHDAGADEVTSSP